jgi:hypothetical protein
LIADGGRPIRTAPPTAVGREDQRDLRPQDHRRHQALEHPVGTDLMPGVVAATHGWGHARTDMRIARERPGANVNRLLASGPGSYDPLSNMAHMTGIEVEVESASSAR